jgi:peptidoglycan/LPS O-acetylase OafA/YrhL
MKLNTARLRRWWENPDARMNTIVVVTLVIAAILLWLCISYNHHHRHDLGLIFGLSLGLLGQVAGLCQSFVRLYRLRLIREGKYIR